MPNSHERVRTKTKVIFTEIAGDRAARLDPSNALEDMKSLVATALQRNFGIERARELAFHMLDWNGEAAFIVALLLYPERFSSDEIEAGITGFLIHAPNHIPAALKIAADRNTEE
jgi:hypothetical protein